MGQRKVLTVHTFSVLSCYKERMHSSIQTVLLLVHVHCTLTSVADVASKVSKLKDLLDYTTVTLFCI